MKWIMNTSVSRITISVPNYLAKRLNTQVQSGQLSKYIVAAIEKQLLLEDQPKMSLSQQLHLLRKKIPRVEANAIDAAVQKGRK